MTPWISFPSFAAASIVLWLVAIIFLCLKDECGLRTKLAITLSLCGTIVLAVFTALLWQKLERPPLRTLGETRLWYSLFMPAIGLICWWRWRLNWLLIYSLLMGGLFLSINLAHPETYNKALMPALRSPWFVPHVVVYIFAYALLAASSLISLRGLLHIRRKPDLLAGYLKVADRLVYMGLGFLSLGLLFGALWAKKAWGHYWTWDPKETWAFLTWASYLIYIHFRHLHQRAVKSSLIILALAFFVLLLCWFGINYMPAAASSVHTYSS